MVHGHTKCVVVFKSTQLHIFTSLFTSNNFLSIFLVHGQVTIIFVMSVGLSVCLSVCLFVCAEFYSAVFDPMSIKLGHVLCLGLVVSPRNRGCATPGGCVTPKNLYFGGF